MYRLVPLLCLGALFLAPLPLCAQQLIDGPLAAEPPPGRLILPVAILIIGLGLAIAGSVIGMNALRKRRDRRFDCNLPARLDLDRGDSGMRLLDISRRGARLRAPALPRGDGPIVIRCGGLRLEGRILWRREGCIGIRLRRPLTRAQIMNLLADDLVAAPQQVART